MGDDLALKGARPPLVLDDNTRQVEVDLELLREGKPLFGSWRGRPGKRREKE